MLGALMQSQKQGEAGAEPISDDSLVSEMLAFLFAGYDTTASMLCSFWVSLTERPDVMEAIAREAASIDPLPQPRTSASASLPEQPWLEAALTETERLHPPLTFALRGLLRDIEFGGYVLRAGSKVAWSPWYTGRMEELFERANEWRPERFLDGKRPPPYTVLGFGGGHRACIGKRFAQQEMRVFINAILRRYRIEAVPNQSSEVFFNPTLQRRHGFRVKLKQIGR